MKIYKFLFFFLIFFSISKSSFSEKVSIVYTVNNDPITSIEIKNEITYLKLINRDLNNMDNKSLVIYASKSILREKIKELEIKKYFKTGMNDEAVKQSLVRLLNTLGLKNINEDVIVSYSDIYYSRKIFKKIKKYKTNQINIPIIKNWMNVWKKKK